MANVTPFEDDAGGRAAAAPGIRAAGDEPQLIVNLDGFEGPLDLLLTLARNQKVDLARISILALAEQYLAYVTQARRLRIELAAGYLVMAAWLAYLKSRLLLPDEEVDAEEPSGPEMAAALARRLRRLAAMRDAAAALMDRPQLGRDVFAAGKAEGLPVHEEALHESTLHELSEGLRRPPHPARASPPADRTQRLSLHGRCLPAHVAAAGQHAGVGDPCALPPPRPRA